MRKNLGKKTFLYPMPVLIIGTYDEKNIPNAMNAAWGGIYDTNQIFICLSSDHKTTKNILLNKEFTVSFATKENMEASDYVGIVSGNKLNKIDKVGWHHSKAEFVNAPLFSEFPVTLECKINKLNEENGTTYVVADIINVSVDEKMLNESEEFDSKRFNPISFDPANNTYREVNKIVGNAFIEGKKIG